MKKIFSLLLLSSLFLLSCVDDTDKPNQEIKWTKEESIKMNTTFSAEEESAIDQFLKRRPDWKMTKTGTGLRYFIYHTNSAAKKMKPKVDDVVTVKFTIELLDGTICYSSEKNETETFVVEKSDIESGLHEGIKYLSLFDRAKLIMPSHLAHGLIGDQDKIPPLETLIFDIELLKITPHHEL